MRHCPSCTCAMPSASLVFGGQPPVQAGMLLMQPNGEGYEGTLYEMPPDGVTAIGDLAVIAQGQYDEQGVLIRDLSDGSP